MFPLFLSLLSVNKLIKSVSLRKHTETTHRQSYVEKVVDCNKRMKAGDYDLIINNWNKLKFIDEKKQAFVEMQIAKCPICCNNLNHHCMDWMHIKQDGYKDTRGGRTRSGFYATPLDQLTADAGANRCCFSCINCHWLYDHNCFDIDSHFQTKNQQIIYNLNVLKNTSSSSSNSGSSNNNNKSGKVYIFDKKKEEDEINEKKVHSFKKLAKFLKVPLECSDCKETDIHLFNYGSSGAELGFPHAMWYDSGIEINGRCFYIYHSGNWNSKTYLLDQNTPKLRLITGTTDINNAIIIRGFSDMVQNKLRYFTPQNCGLKIQCLACNQKEQHGKKIER